VDGAGDATYVVLTDDRGTVMSVADTAGNVVEKLFYNSTGLAKACNAAGIELTNTYGEPVYKSRYVRLGWTGMHRDPFTGLYHTHFRDFDPLTARWTSEDPAGYADGLNLYAAYFGVNGVDALGLLDEPELLANIQEIVNRRGKYYEAFLSRGFSASEAGRIVHGYVEQDLALLLKDYPEWQGRVLTEQSINRLGLPIKKRPGGLFFAGSRRPDLVILAQKDYDLATELAKDARERRSLRGAVSKVIDLKFGEVGLNPRVTLDVCERLGVQPQQIQKGVPGGNLATAFGSVDQDVVAYLERQAQRAEKMGKLKRVAGKLAPPVLSAGLAYLVYDRYLKKGASQRDAMAMAVASIVDFDTAYEAAGAAADFGWSKLERMDRNIVGGHVARLRAYAEDSE